MAEEENNHGVKLNGMFLLILKEEHNGSQF